VSGTAAGKPRQLTRFNSPSRVIYPYLNALAYSTSRDKLVLPMTETTGAIWILDHVDQ
jgi:hypothetical protein